MRILIKEGKHIIIKEVPEVRKTNSGNIGIPKWGKQYLTGNHTDELLGKLLVDGYADMTGFEEQNYLLVCPL